MSGGELAPWLRGVVEADLSEARACEEEAVASVARGRNEVLSEAREQAARCEGELAVLDEHARLNDSIWCRTCDPGGESGDSAAWYPCRTVRLLGYGYRFRPGYREAEWKP